MLRLLCLAAVATVALGYGASPKFAPSCGTSQYPDAGKPPTRVVGGWEARKNELPWQVALVSPGSSYPFCGGVILDTNYIITAAHCVNGREPEDVEVKLGEHDVSDDNDDATIHTITKITINERYGESFGNDNDIAMMKMDKPITFSDKQRGICKPTNDVNFYTGKNVIASGWGTLESGGDSPNILNLVVVDIKDNSTCELEYPGSIDQNSMVCAGGDGKDTCQGDSGGPLVYNNNGKHELIGLVSWGRGCAQEPGVYTRVHAFLDWIENVRKS